MRRVFASVMAAAILLCLTSCGTLKTMQMQQDDADTPSGESAEATQELSDGSNFTHDDLIAVLDEFAVEQDIAGVSNIFPEMGEQDGTIRHMFKYCGGLVHISVFEREGAVVAVNVITYPEEYSLSGTIEEAFETGFYLATHPLALCEPQSDRNAMTAWHAKEYENATIGRRGQLETRSYASDEWTYKWEKGSVSLAVWATHKSYTQISTDATIVYQPPYATSAPTTTSSATVPTSAGSFTVRLDAATPIHSGPSYDFSQVGTVGQSTVYTIVEESINGTERWGKLKSGLGWVCLSMPYGDVSSEYHTTNYTVRLEVGTPIYSNPSPANEVGAIVQSTMYTIVEECTNNAGKWGKLKSGLGWVELSE